MIKFGESLIKKNITLVVLLNILMKLKAKWMNKKKKVYIYI